jgi:hypothetical protein
MKHLRNIVILLFFCSTVQAQMPGPGYPCNTLPALFECATTVWYDTIDLATQQNLFHIDTLNSDNVWEFGTSNKTSFNGQLGFVTDTVNSYPMNSKSMLEYRMPNSGNLILMFEHKYETDSLTDGGYVQFSCDQGQSWGYFGNYYFNPLNCWGFLDNYYNYPNASGWTPWESTIQDTLYAFTGSSDWTWSAVQIFALAVRLQDNATMKADADSIYFRFVFESDDIDSDKDGWMIRQVVTAYSDIASGIDDINPSNNPIYYPNPTTDKIQIDLGTTGNDIIINAYNVVGELVQTETQNAAGLIDYQMPKSKGVYVIQLVHPDGKVTNLKVVKE